MILIGTPTRDNDFCNKIAPEEKNASKMPAAMETNHNITLVK